MNNHHKYTVDRFSPTDSDNAGTWHESMDFDSFNAMMIQANEWAIEGWDAVCKCDNAVIGEVE